MQGPLLPSHVRVIPIRDAPCECLPPPFKCWVGTINELPENCDTNGDVYTVLSVPWCDHPVQFFCWNGEWYPIACQGPPVQLSLTCDGTQVDNGVALPEQAGLPHAMTVGNGSTWNTLYNEGGFTVLASGEAVIPETGVYHIEGTTRLRHLMPILDGYPVQPYPNTVAWPPVPNVNALPHWVEAHWVSGLLFDRVPYFQPIIAVSVVWAFKTPSYPQNVVGLGVVDMSIALENSISADVYLTQGTVLGLRQHARDGQPVLEVGPKFWFEAGMFTIRKVS